MHTSTPAGHHKNTNAYALPPRSSTSPTRTPSKSCATSTEQALMCKSRAVPAHHIYFICTFIALQSHIVPSYAHVLRRLYVWTPVGTPDDPEATPRPNSPMTTDAFTASLERSAASHPPSKARRIAALLPQIEAAMSQGSPRAHIVIVYDCSTGEDVTIPDLFCSETAWPFNGILISSPTLRL